MKPIYKITLKNWEKYNGTKKKGHRCILLYTGYLSDAKIRSLSHVAKLLHLSCMLLAGESNSSHIEVSHDSLVFHSGVKSGSLQSQLDLLQSLQLLTYEKIEPLLDRIGKDRKEKERKGMEASLRAPSASPPQNVVAFYCEHWKSRYGTNPPITNKVAGQLNLLEKEFGERKARKFIAGFLSMPDPWFVTKRHDVSTMLTNLNAVAQFLETGKLVTKGHLQELSEKVDENFGPKPAGIAQILEEKRRRENALLEAVRNEPS